MVGLDSAILMHPRAWKASGHVDGFTDPMVRLQGKCKKRFRADHLERRARARRREPSKSPLDCGGELTERAQLQPDVRDLPRPGQDESSKVYLRPETAQGIFVNFTNVLQCARKKPPFGIAQVGKSFRNEITPGNFIFRSREFEQMEMEFFCRPAARGVVPALGGRAACGGTPTSACAPTAAPARARRRARPLLQGAPPTSSTCSRSAGASSRGSPTAATSISTQHAEFSGEKLELRRPGRPSERYIPYVIEPAAGADRATLALLCDAYDEEEVKGRERGGAAPAPEPGAGQGRGAAAHAARTASPSGRARSTRTCASAIPAEYDTGGRSASATAARTRSARRCASPSTTRRSRTTR